MKPIYKPKGKAGEYGDYALNIYDSCNHGCTYCYARPMAARFGRAWGEVPSPRDGILEATYRQLEDAEFSNAFGDQGKLIHLCFTCDPYPVGVDTTVTREIIKAIKVSGNHVQILTKGGSRAYRDFELLDDHDWFGVSISGYRDVINKHEPNAACWISRITALKIAKASGINTWVSCEPVYDVEAVYDLIAHADYIDLYKIGKLNYHPSYIDWGEFGRECERLCKLHGRNYYIKEDLRKCMEG